MKPTRDRGLRSTRWVGCLLAVLSLLLPAHALADVIPGEVGDVVDEVTETVDEIGDEVTEGVDDAVEEVTDAVDEVAGVPGDVVGSNPSAPGDEQGNDGGSDGPGPPATEPERDEIGSPPRVGEAHPVRRDVDRPVSRLVLHSALQNTWVRSVQTVEGDTDPSAADPCNDDVELVCLGLLYGLGDYVDNTTQVLGLLAMTGIGVFSLILLAVGLGMTGSMALLGSRYRAAATGGGSG
jgi:hypothetical protein